MMVQPVMPKYGVLFSVRHKVKETNDLINAISIRFGSSIKWGDRYVTGGASFDQCIWRKFLSDPPIYFKLHGNKFSNFLELYCKDISILQVIRAVFPADFIGEVEVKEGLC